MLCRHARACAAGFWAATGCAAAAQSERARVACIFKHVEGTRNKLEMPAAHWQPPYRELHEMMLGDGDQQRHPCAP